MDALAKRKPLSRRHKLDEQPGSCVAKSLVDLDFLFVAGVSPFHDRLASTVAARAEPPWAAHRQLSFDVFFPEYPPFGRGGSSFLPGDVVSGSKAGKAMAGIGLENSGGWRPETGLRRWILL